MVSNKRSCRRGPHALRTLREDDAIRTAHAQPCPVVCRRPMSMRIFVLEELIGKISSFCCYLFMKIDVFFIFLVSLSFFQMKPLKVIYTGSDFFGYLSIPTKSCRKRTTKCRSLNNCPWCLNPIPSYPLVDSTKKDLHDHYS